MKNNIPTIIVDPELRELILPSEKLVLGINGDVEVNTVQFQLPLIYRELELKRLTPRINYVNANGDANYYESTMESDESNCYFIWPITPDITAYTGHVRFSLTLYQTEEGTILHKFNTRSAVGRVYTGFEAEKQVTPEQQQTLLSKLETQIKEDLNDHTERLKNELTEKGKEILDGFGESGSASEELKTIKQDLNQKLTAPPTPEVGKILKIRSVNEDGTFVCEWADDGSNLDVRINGENIVQDGVADIPVANGVKYGSSYGLVHFVAGYCYGIETGRTKTSNYEATDGIKLVIPSTAGMNGRYNPGTNGFGAITTNTFDYAVKAAMCDGKGAAWTAEEQAAARDRMGAWTTIADITLDEDINSIDGVSVQGYRKYSVVVLLSQRITVDCYIQPRLICGNSMSTVAYESAKNMTFLFFDIEEFGYIGGENSASLFGCESYKNEIGAISPNIFKYSTVKINYNSAGKFPFLTGIGVVVQGASIPSGSRIIIRGHS